MNEWMYTTEENLTRRKGKGGGVEREGKKEREIEKRRRKMKRRQQTDFLLPIICNFNALFVKSSIECRFCSRFTQRLFFSSISCSIKQVIKHVLLLFTHLLMRRQARSSGFPLVFLKGQYCPLQSFSSTNNYIISFLVALSIKERLFFCEIHHVSKMSQTPFNYHTHFLNAPDVSSDINFQLIITMIQ